MIDIMKDFIEIYVNNWKQKNDKDIWRVVRKAVNDILLNGFDDCSKYHYNDYKKSDVELFIELKEDSTKRQNAISQDIAADIAAFLRDYDKDEQEIGEDIYTKTNYLESAVNLLSKVNEQINK